ncbi:MAG: SDR family oxidoreductase [Deltaproteobacteria bacterium]|nr:SDR family oxidoreductase [Deltaproteobacteria bacterium]
MARLSTLSRSIEGKVALVTGAASGMGRATARLLADEGAKVAVTDLRLETVGTVVDEIRAAGGSAEGWVLDVADPGQIEAVVEEIAERLGGLDILVNNAGIAVGSSVDADDYEVHWQRAMDVLLTAHVRLIRAALPLLERSGEGRVVNIASVEGLGGSANTSPYTAAKHGVVGLTRSLACDLGPRGIAVNCICPWPILTCMTQVIPEAAREKFARRRVPLRRYGTPEEVAHMTLSLVLPAASYVTGAAIAVDGGMTIKNN